MSSTSAYTNGGPEDAQDASMERIMQDQVYTDGDIVLRSTDKVDFRVHSYHLQSASSVFRDILADVASDPHIKLTETAETIRRLLGIMVPTEISIDHGKLGPLPLDHFSRLFLAMDKYDVHRVGFDLLDAWTVANKKDPVAFFILVCQHHLERFAKASFANFKTIRSKVDGRSPTNLAPWTSTGREIGAAVGYAVFESYLEAYMSACKVKVDTDLAVLLSRVTTIVDWTVVAEKFHL